MVPSAVWKEAASIPSNYSFMSIYRFDSVTQQIYHQLCDTIKNQQFNIQLPAFFPAEQILNLYKKAISESKQGYLYQPCSIRALSSIISQTVSLDFCSEAHSYIKTSCAVEFELDLIAREAMLRHSKYDTIKAVHSYFVRNFRYAYNHMNDSRYNSGASVFLYRESVCEGFALAYAIVLNRMGIPCGIVMGKSNLNGQLCDHAWNIVKLGTNFYHVDVTWDICSKEKSDQNCFDYLLLDDHLAQLDHHWNDRTLPPCLDPTQDFYARTGLLCTNQGDCIRTISKQLRRKQKNISFRLTSTNMTSVVNSDVIPALLLRASRETGIAISDFHYYSNPNIGTVHYQLHNQN